MADEWGPWIEHDGKGCPVLSGQYLRATGSNGAEVEGVMRNPRLAFGWDWMGPSGNPCDFIIRYRVRKPRALLEMIARAEALPRIAPEPAR